MKQRTKIQLRVLTPAIAAAILAAPAWAQRPPETLEHQQRDQYRQELDRLQPNTPAENESDSLGLDANRARSNPNWETTQDAGRTDRAQPATDDPSRVGAARSDIQGSDHWSQDKEGKGLSDPSALKSAAHGGQLGHIEKASDVIGYDIRDNNNDEIGEIEDLLVDLNTGKIVLAVVEVGGVGPFGAEYYGVPPSALQTGIHARSFRMDKNQLTSTPKLELSKMALTTDHQTLSQIYGAHGQSYHSDSFVDAVKTSSVEGTRTADAILRERQSEDVGANPDSDRQLVRGGLDDNAAEASTPSADNPPQDIGDAGANDRAGSVSGRDNWGPASGVTSSGIRSSSGVSDTDTSPVAHASASSLGLVRASELIGSSLSDNAGQDVGKIRDLAVDMQNGRVVSAIVSSGGFLGFGAERAVVPPQAIEGASDSALRLKGTREQFKSAPRLSGSRDWPMQDRQYVSDVYRAFGVDPYFEGQSGATQEREAYRSWQEQRSGQGAAPAQPQNKNNAPGQDWQIQDAQSPDLNRGFDPGQERPQENLTPDQDASEENPNL